jgi:hypothetical protein
MRSRPHLSRPSTGWVQRCFLVCLQWCVDAVSRQSSENGLPREGPRGVELAPLRSDGLLPPSVEAGRPVGRDPDRSSRVLLRTSDSPEKLALIYFSGEQPPTDARYLRNMQNRLPTPGL